MRIYNPEKERKKVSVDAYITSPDGCQIRNFAAYAAVTALSKKHKTAVFRPAACKKETLSGKLVKIAGTEQTVCEARGICPKQLKQDTETSRSDIARAYIAQIAEKNYEAAVIIGNSEKNAFDPLSFITEAQIAADLNAPIILALSAENRTADDILQTVEFCKKTIKNECASLAEVFVTFCDEETEKQINAVKAEFGVPAIIFSKQVCSEFAKASKECCAESCAEGSTDTKDADKTTADKAAMAAANAISGNTAAEIVSALESEFKTAVTPYAFQANLLEKAKKNKKTVILPEGHEDRIIKAADYLLERDIANLIIVGEEADIKARAEQLGLKNLDKAKFMSQNDEKLLAEMTDKLVELREKKGMTPEKARAQLADESYFGTMAVVLGYADGLVSGSVNSTANTVRPALQVIKTKPGASIVSGAFIMCFKDHAAIFADCAINLNPDAEQIAQIAIQSAQTARIFGIEPKVGLLSYSTLGSGKGPDVELMEQAAQIVREKAPEIASVGPIQFDAAWSPVVAAKKAAGNDVAGKVNVFVFPDLSAGNICYKAVQRSSGTLAIGPVLQGLNRPVNDLSRGALVEDIINTIALTSIYAAAE